MEGSRALGGAFVQEEVILRQHFKFYFDAFRRLEIYNKAASLSYYTIISVFPMLLLFTAAIGYFVPERDWIAGVNRFLENILPLQSDLIASNLRALFRNRVKFSWFGLVSLIVSAQMLYVNMDRIINRILHATRKRNVLITRAVFFPWLAGMVFILFTPVLFDIIYAKMKTYGLKISLLSLIAVKGGFLLAAFLTFCFIMAMLPLQKLSPLRVAKAGASFALTIQAGKFVFKLVVLTNLVRYNLVYGSLSSIVLGLLWVFYFYNVFLFFVYWTGRRFDPHYVERKFAAPGGS